MFLILVAVLALQAPSAQPAPPSAQAPAPPPAAAAPASQQVTAQRNENIQINQIDNNALVERLGRDGAQARPIQDFSAVRADYGAPFGGLGANLNIIGLDRKSAYHGEIYETLQNSVFNARTFFQAGPVRPTRRNQYGFNVGGPILRDTLSFVLAGEEIRQSGYVNGNVLVPLADERNPRTTDPALYALIAKWLAVYPKELPNRAEIDVRMLNTNALQTTRTSGGNFRLDWQPNSDRRVASRYSMQDTFIDSFEFVVGQNPNQRLRPQSLNLSWTERVSDRTTLRLGTNYIRAKVFLLVPPGSVGPQVFMGRQIQDLGPPEQMPIQRIRNDFEYLFLGTHITGDHQIDFGSETRRYQMNDLQSDELRHNFGFNANFGRSAVENFLLGIPTGYRGALGNAYRGFRNTDVSGFLNDRVGVTSNLQLSLGLRYEFIGKTTEVNQLTNFGYGHDTNNFAPRFGFAYKIGRQTVRGGYGIAFGRIFPATLSWARFNPPAFQRFQLNNPDLLNPLKDLTLTPGESQRSSWNLLDETLVAPYSQQYTLQIDRELPGGLQLQASYIGSRTWKLPQMIQANRATRPAGIAVTTATINDRRPDQRYYALNVVTNMGRAYFDAAQIVVQKRALPGLAFNMTYQFSKAIDTGSDFSSTGIGGDETKAQFENDIVRDVKALSKFDTPHRFLFTYTYELPTRWLRAWSMIGALNLHSGTPFGLEGGTDSPPWGNVDGQGQDRPSLVDLNLLGKSFDNPDTSQSLLRRDAFVLELESKGFGTLGRNVFRRDGVANFNIALERTFLFSSDRTRTAVFRAEALNMTNHPQFDLPTNAMSSPSFGQITNTLNGGRIVQFGLNLKF